MAKKETHWYSISFIGGLLVALYAFIPPFVVYADTIGVLPATSRVVVTAGMGFVTLIVFVARKQGKQLFARHRPKSRVSERGFTLMELLVVISIIGILSAIAVPVFNNAREAAYFSRAKSEFRSVAVAIELHSNATGVTYPPDVDRGLPPGLEAYLSGGNWPNAPWPGSIYDWDVWMPADLAYPPYEPVYQISVRFCPLNAPSQCRFPNDEWAEDFDYHSAAYYCISGSCRAHASKPVTHPGYCVNC